MANFVAKQGATEIWSDGEKIIIRNPTGFKWIEANVDAVFGDGEFQKIYEVKYYHNEIPGKINKTSRAVEICSGYIPQKVKDEMFNRFLPGTAEEDLVNKYFQRVEEDGEK